MSIEDEFTYYVYVEASLTTYHHASVGAGARGTTKQTLKTLILIILILKPVV